MKAVVAFLFCNTEFEKKVSVKQSTAGGGVSEVGSRTGGRAAGSSTYSKFSVGMGNLI